MADLALLLCVFQRAEGVGERNGGVDAMELVKVDAIEPEVAQGELELLLQVVGATAGLGFGGALAGEAALGGYDETGGVGVKGLGNQLFGDLRAVGVGGVEEVDAEFERPAKDVAGVLTAGRLAPGALADQPHGAIAEAVDGEVIGDRKGTGGRGVRGGCSTHAG